MKIVVNCPKCGKNKTDWIDSVPYCPKCGRAMQAEHIIKGKK